MADQQAEPLLQTPPETAMASPGVDDIPTVSARTTVNNQAPPATDYRDSEDERFLDDGHIHVCVRIRDVPSHPAHTPKGHTGPRKSMSNKEANKICVSTIDNVVVMHDPKSLDDSSALARDTNNVVQLLTDRANAPGGAGGARGGRPSSGKPSRTRSSQRRSTFTRGLTSTATASYYECDRCITSMDESAAMRMPLIRGSDFLPPPAYGSQETVYCATARHAVKAAVDGINSCVFAYGQTGSGKTYTLFGDTENIRADPGVVPRTLDDLFERLQAVKTSHSSNPETDYSYTVALSFFEIYQNDVYCLLSRQGPLHVQFSRDTQGKKETMVIHDLQQQTVTSAEKAYPLIELGLRRRQTGETGMNARSSRSHAIFQIRVAQFTTSRETRETVELHSTINLVDLAGSERQKTAKTEGKNRDEGIQINQSLATLARVINDIASGAKFINYRDSLLTMVLKDNLGGNSKTFMIAAVSPVAFSYQESCSTLTYAKAVRKIRNRPTVNRTFQTRANLVEQNARLKAENDKLKDQMEAWMKRLQQAPQPYPLVDESAAGSGTPFLLDGISPIRGGGANAMDDLSGFLRGANAAGGGEVVPGHDGVVHTEALIAAASAGLTAPLLVSSHRRYTSVAGIGMACVEGGVVRVASLVRQRMVFPLSLPRHDTAAAAATEPPAIIPRTPTEQAVAEQGRATLEDRLSPSVSVSPEVASLAVQSDDANRNSTAASPAARPVSGACDLGYVELERVCQRSCEQHFWVRYVAPPNVANLGAALTVQLNGKDLGATRRELYHGDVICAYVDDPHIDEEQHLLTYHYVDLNCLSRTSASTNRATLGQLAISVELPEEVENLTLENIQQLQRDNAKLLDMVRQQAQTVDYHVQKEASRARLESVTRLSSALGSRSLSPNPHAQHDGSGMPADMDEEALRQRAREAAASEERLDSVMRENADLHKKAARRNAALDALAAQLAALEGGEGTPDDGEGSDDDDEDMSQGEAHRVSVSVSPSLPRGASHAHEAPSADTTNNNRFPFSMSRVSSPSSSSEEDEESDERAATTAPASGKSHRSPPLPALRAADAEPAASQIKIFYENADGTRERYNAAVRHREQQTKILELEAIIDDLRMQLAMLESRLRVAKEDTTEEELARSAAEAERDALLRQLQELQTENSDLTRDNAALEAICHQNEDALHQATTMNEEEIERRLAVLAAKNKALYELARLWKRRTMRHIASGYGAGGGVGTDGSTAPAAGRARLTEIPWDEMRYGATAEIAKRRLVSEDGIKDGGLQSDNGTPGHEGHMLNTVDEFERATAVDSLIAMEAALKDFESENRRLQAEVERYEAMLRDLKDLIARLRGERDELEKEAANAATNEEESRRLNALLEAKVAQLRAAEANLEETQNQLSSAIEQTEENKRRARKNNELLLAEQKRTIAQLEDRVDVLETNLNGKEEELRNLLRFMEQNELAGAGAGGVVQDYQLRSRVEDLITEAMKDYDAPTSYSAFPVDFEFSEEMIALIRVCLRILLDRLKVELYVLNRQNLHKLGLMMPTVQLRPEAQFHSFMHELRGVVVEIAGRAQRIGGRWSVSEADVLADFVDHRRRRASGALYGLLVWYDHWDMSPKLEHVCYMELIRNSDRVLQMARLIRQQDALNTNGTSTLMMPIPGKHGCSDAVPLGDASKKSDQTTIEQSCQALNKMNASMRRSNLARFCNSPSKLAVPVEDDYELNSNNGEDEAESRSVGKNLFRRTATALVMSQTTHPFGRTPTTGGMTYGHVDLSPTKLSGLSAARRGSDCPMPLARRNSTLAPQALSSTPGSESLSSRSPAQDRTPPLKANANAPPAPPVLSRRASAAGVPPSAFSRVASSSAMPVSDADVAFVTSSEMAYVGSINEYNCARRAGRQTGPSHAAAAGEPLERKRTSNALPFSRHASALSATRARGSGGHFNRSATAVVMPASLPSKGAKAKRLSGEEVPRPSGSTAPRASSGSSTTKAKQKLARSQTAIPTRLGSGGSAPSRPKPRASGGEGRPSTPVSQPAAAPRRTAPGGLAAPRVAGTSLFGRTKSTLTGSLTKTGPARANTSGQPAKLTRSQTTTAGLGADKAPRRSSAGGTGTSKRKAAKLIITEAAAESTTRTTPPDHSARSLSTALASPKPRTPCGVASKTKAFPEPQLSADSPVAGVHTDAAAGVGRTSAGGPTPSFYNPTVLNALRERSTSESNQAGMSGKTRGSGEASRTKAQGKAKLKRTGAARKTPAHSTPQ